MTMTDALEFADEWNQGMITHGIYVNPPLFRIFLSFGF